jgi:sugar lactone lactonase YvrE
MTIEIIGQSRDLVGESPFWDAVSGRLAWVDIVGRKVRLLDTASGELRTHEMPDYPTAIALGREGGDAALTCGGDVGRFNVETGAFKPFATPEEGEGVAMRLNEGKCDPSGRFWVSSMDNNLHPDGSARQMQGSRGRLFRVDGDGTVTAFGEAELGIPNTMAWSPDRTTFYMGDTLRNILWAYDYDDASGTVSNRRVFAEGGPGLPDGSGIDSQGYLWNARFSAGCLIRFAPDGRQDRIIELPVKNPTACTFGGPELRHLYITSGSFGLDTPGEADGALLRMETSVSGAPENHFAG